MPTTKEFINGFDFPKEPKQFRKKKFDKSVLVEDNEKSCHNCKNTKLLDADRKHGFTYQCLKSNYVFRHYWIQTNASNCKDFEVKKSE